MLCVFRNKRAYSLKTQEVLYHLLPLDGVMCDTYHQFSPEPWLDHVIGVKWTSSVSLELNNISVIQSSVGSHTIQ